MYTPPISPCNTEYPYIFISYSSKDSQLVWQDVAEFQKRGYNIWLDEMNLNKTKPSWKDDALNAIVNFNCHLLVFYVSRHSLTSKACLEELQKTRSIEAQNQHIWQDTDWNVKFIAVDTEDIDSIPRFITQQAQEIMRSKLLSQQDKFEQNKILSTFFREFFNSNNERVRIRWKGSENRKVDYYSDILNSFPEDTRIFMPAEGNRAEASAPGSDIAAAEKSTVPPDEGERSFALGKQYYEGNGVEQNYEKAFGYFKTAALLGHIRAMTSLGDCYCNGEGTEEDDRKGLYWYQKAAELGDAEAFFCIGVLCRGGYGVEKDYKQAFNWYEKAAKLNHVEAMTAVAGCYYYGEGVPKNFEKYIHWMEKAADLGDLDAISELCSTYYTGSSDAVPNYAKAVYWGKKGAELGDTASINILADCYREGKGVPQNDQEAFRLYTKAANSGSNDYSCVAMYHLGQCYLEGKGTPIDYKMAAHWLERAAQNGFKKAMRSVAVCYAQGKGVPMDKGKAAEWLKRSEQ